MITVNFGPDRIKVAPITQDAWQALASVLAAHSYDIRTTDTDSYNCRAITGGTGRSLHSFGIALDINWTTNPFIKTPDKRKVRFSDQPTQAERAQDVKRHLADTDMTEAMIVDVLAIKTTGGKGVFEWGGYWTNVKDAMHFEIDLSPADVAVGIDWDTVKMADLPDGDTVKHDDSINEEARPAMTPSAAFEAVHPFIAKWEGGFVNHPQDPGGATNFGITIDTLSRWRGTKASVADVRNMSVEEARQIFYANYWMPLRADEMPLSVALMTYNAGVNSGPSRGAKLLQRALNDHGQNLEVDGRIGARTVAAIYKVDERRLVDSFAGAHENFYRGLSGFGTFGKGWLNRLFDVTAGARGFVGVTPTAQPEIETTTVEVTRPATPTDSGLDLLGPLAVLAELLRYKSGRGQSTSTPGAQGAGIIDPDLGILLRALLEVAGEARADRSGGAVVPPAPVAKEKEQLTSVNGALGTTIGGLLNGRKTGIGTLGILGTAILPLFFPQLAPLSSIISVIGGVIDPEVASSATAVAVDTGHVVTPNAPIGAKIMSVLQPLFMGLTGWGVLGKMDKWSNNPKD